MVDVEVRGASVGAAIDVDPARNFARLLSRPDSSSTYGLSFSG